MRSAVRCAVWTGIGALALGGASFAQLRDNSEKQMACQNGGYDSDGVRHCEMREQTVPAIGRLSVDGEPERRGHSERLAAKRGTGSCARGGFGRHRKRRGESG
jgi:hypothetical protein